VLNLMLISQGLILGSMLTFILYLPILMVLLIQSYTAMVPRLEMNGVWRWIGLKVMVIVGDRPRYIRDLDLGQTDAQHGAVVNLIYIIIDRRFI